MIEHVSGQPYAQYVEQATLVPMGIRAVRMTPVVEPQRVAPYLPGEAHRYFAGTVKSLPAGHGGPMGAAGGWAASAVALAKFLTAVDGTRTGKPFLSAATMQQMLARPTPPLTIRKNNTWFGLGWDSVHEMPNWPHWIKNRPTLWRTAKTAASREFPRGSNTCPAASIGWCCSTARCATAKIIPKKPSSPPKRRRATRCRIRAKRWLNCCAE